MDPIRYVDTLNDHYRSQGNPPYRWSVNETAPLHRLAKPLSDAYYAVRLIALHALYHKI